MIKNKRSASNFDLKLFVNDEQDNPDLAVRPIREIRSQQTTDSAGQPLKSENTLKR